MVPVSWTRTLTTNHQTNLCDDEVCQKTIESKCNIPQNLQKGRKIGSLRPIKNIALFPAHRVTKINLMRAAAKIFFFENVKRLKSSKIRKFVIWFLLGHNRLDKHISDNHRRIWLISKHESCEMKQMKCRNACYWYMHYDISLLKREIKNIFLFAAGWHRKKFSPGRCAGNKAIFFFRLRIIQ